MKSTTDQPFSEEPSEEITVASTPSAYRGVYANFAVVKHTKEEFILDFFLLPGDKGQLVSRVVLSPTHAKRLHRAFGDNLAKFEATHGEIVQPPSEESPAPVKGASAQRASPPQSKGKRAKKTKAKAAKRKRRRASKRTSNP